jgi:2-methylcitrate dehydratase
VPSTFHQLSRHENQALGLGQFAIEFLAGRLGEINAAVYERVELFHLDSIACGVSAIACGTNAPTVLRDEALQYRRDNSNRGACCFGSGALVAPEKAVAANGSAVREWDANGTNFGYNPARGDTAGEFGHNDFYPVAVAAAQQRGLDGAAMLRGMILLDEIRGRLAEVFALHRHKIDHVVHGAIASAAVYGAMMGADAEEIESAIGLVVSHYVPFRAIRAGKQLSDSKGASAALAAEMAVLSVHRAMAGFVGPRDIFRNPQALFCWFEPPASADEGPFDLHLATGGDEFALMGMHFKLGLYEHQSAGAIEGLIRLLVDNPTLMNDVAQITTLRITTYQPAYSIIGDPAKRDPRTRQSADHSMVYIIATLLRKAIDRRQAGWSELMLLPEDYDEVNLHNPLTRKLMQRIEFRHGGPEFDEKYPDGIPTMLEIEHRKLGGLCSGLVMYPEGHARNTSGNLPELLRVKFQRLAELAVDDPDALHERFSHLADRSAEEIAGLYDFDIKSNIETSN